MKTSKKNIKIILIIALLLLAILSLSIGIKKGLTACVDFQWDSTKVLSMKVDPYEASLTPDHEYRLIYEKWYDMLAANQFPSLLWILVPYIIFEPDTANALWLVSNILFLVGIIFISRLTFWKDLKNLDFILLVALLISSSPIRRQLSLGQHTVFSVFFFLLSWWIAAEGKKNNINDFLSGICLAISYFKYSITAPMMLLFVHKRKYKPVVISIVFHIVLTLFSSVWLGRNPVYLLTKPLEVASYISSDGFADVGSILGAFGITGNINLIPTIVLFVMLAIFAFVDKSKTDEEFFSIVTLVSLVFMYHRPYDFFVLIFPLALLMKQNEKMDIKRNILQIIKTFSIVWVVLEMFIADSFIDPYTSVGMRLRNTIGIYDSLYNGYIISVIVMLYISIFMFCFRKNDR